MTTKDDKAQEEKNAKAQEEKGARISTPPPKPAEEKVTSEGNPSVSRRTQAEMQGGKQALKNQQAGNKPKTGE